MAVSHDATTGSASTINHIEASFLHTSSGTQRGLLVALHIWDASGNGTGSAVSYGGTALTLEERVTREYAGPAQQVTEIWSLLGQEPGTRLVSVTFSETVTASYVAALSFNGVSGFGVSDNNTGLDNSPTITFTITSGSLAVAAVSFEGADGSPFTPGSGTTELYDTTTNGDATDDLSVVAGYETGTSVTIDWTASASDEWAVAAVEIQAATAPGYPDTVPVTIEINSVDRTSSIPVESIRIEDPSGTPPAKASLLVQNGSAFSLTPYQTVLIYQNATRLFAGIITQIREVERGPLLDYELECEDFTWDFYHAEALVDTTYVQQNDEDIILDFMPTSLPDIDEESYTANIATVGPYEWDEVNAVQPGEAMEQIARAAGAEWFVDFGPGVKSGDKANLHYYSSGDYTAPYNLSDSPDLSATFPYEDLVEVREVPQANRVLVYGSGTITTTRTTGAEGDYGRWFTAVLKDDNITDATQANDRGDNFLAEHGTEGPSFTCRVRQPGLRAGQSIQLTNSLRSISAVTYIIRRVRTSFLSGGYALFDIELGKEIPRLAELLAERTGGSGSGGGKSRGGHGHTGGADGDKIGTGGTTGINYYETITTGKA